MSMPLKPSKAEAQRYLDMLDPGGEFTFQTFDDNQVSAISALGTV